MTANNAAIRIRHTIAGLCAGDAITWTSWWHRLNQLPPRRSLRLSQAHTDARAAHSTSMPTPYLHATAPDVIDPAGPTDDAEWFTVAVRHHLGQALDGSNSNEDVWYQLAALRAQSPDTVRGRLGTNVALENLAAGLRPPTSGHDNVHWFDDQACIRAVAAGILRPGSPTEAADLAEDDARFTHAEDGVWGARAVAALVSVLVTAADRSDAIEAARAQLPAAAWITSVVDECLEVVDTAAGTLELAARLERGVVDHVYAYANQAPETLGLLLAHLRVAETGEALMLGALAHPRHADGLVPLAGAVAGAGFATVTRDLSDLALNGVTISALAGTKMRDVADAVVASAVRAAQSAVGELS